MRLYVMKLFSSPPGRNKASFNETKNTIMQQAVLQLRPYLRTISSNVRSPLQLVADTLTVLSFLRTVASPSLCGTIDLLVFQLSAVSIDNVFPPSAANSVSTTISLSKQDQTDMVLDRMRCIRQEVLANRPLGQQQQQQQQQSVNIALLSLWARLTSIIILCDDVIRCADDLAKIIIAGSSNDASSENVDGILQRGTASLHESKALLALAITDDDAVSELSSSASHYAATLLRFLTEVDAVTALFFHSPRFMIAAAANQQENSQQRQQDEVTNNIAALFFRHGAVPTVSLFAVASSQLYRLRELEGCRHAFRPPESFVTFRRKLVEQLR